MLASRLLPMSIGRASSVIFSRILFLVLLVLAAPIYDKNTLAVAGEKVALEFRKKFFIFVSRVMFLTLWKAGKKK